MNVNLAIVVEKRKAEEVKNLLIEKNLLDDLRKIKRYGDKVEIPVKDVPSLPYRFDIVEQKEIVGRKIFNPFEEIKKRLRGEKDRGS